jgi:hypothetical protein
MALVTANDVAVVRGSILRPLVGVWTADLEIDQSDAGAFAAGTSVTIKSANGYSLTGTVAENRSGSFLDAVYVRVLGGAGGMSQPSSARSYVQPGAFVRDVMNGLCADSGETLSTTADASFLALNLTAWSTIGGNPAMRNLRALLDIVAPALNWRILADGTLWIGSESWTQVTTDFQVMHQDPEDGSFHIGIESPFIVPGTSLPGVGNVATVRDDIEDGHLRSRVWVDIPGSNRGIAGATQLMAKQALAGVDYYATYVCQVVSQSSDLATVDISPVGARNQSLIGGLQRVPVRFMGGIKTQMTPGSTVLLGWDGGSPEGPYVTSGAVGDTAIKIALSDVANDSLEISAGTVTVKIGGVTVIQASATSLALGLIGALPVLVQGTTDAIFGVPVLQNPAAIATIVKAG